MPPEYDTREQSQIKHFVLKSYLDAASRIIGFSQDFTYVDCCAGPWNSKAGDYSDTSFAIAVKALRSSAEFLATRNRTPAFRCLLIESSDKYEELHSFSQLDHGPVSVTSKQWDFADHTREIVSFVRNPRSFAFVFIDPKGWNLARISKLKPLLELSPGEVLINLMSSFVTRFVNDERQDFADLLGPGFGELRKLSGTEREDAIVRSYCAAVKSAGHFDYVCPLPVMKPQHDAFNFHLIYATRNKKGIEKFKEVERRTERETQIVRASAQSRKRADTGTRDLFGESVLYRSGHRFEQFAQKNAALAKEVVESLTQSPVSYDDCWAAALQFPTVREEHLREWLLHFETTGRIAIEGRKRLAEVLKIESGHRIKPRKS